MAESKLRELSMDFAVAVIKLCDQMKGHRSLVNQLERSATSIGANIHEANYAHGRADFIAKLQIAQKEASETLYWLDMIYSGEYISERLYRSFGVECRELLAMLAASIKTACR